MTEETQTTPEKIPSRHKIRVRVMQALYAYFINVAAYEELKEEYQKLGQELPSHLDKMKDPQYHFDLLLEELYAPLLAHAPASADFLRELYFGTIQNVDKHRKLIESFLRAWKWERLFWVDKCVLLAGVHELQTFMDIPIRVTLNEWIEIGKDFGTPKSPAFINGLLDTIRQHLQAQEESPVRHKPM